MFSTWRSPETISKLFEANVVVVCPGDDAPTLDALAGAAATLTFATNSGMQARFHGMLAKVKALDDGSGAHAVFALHLVPMAWMAKLVSTLDIYLNQSVPDIIASKLELLDLAAGRDFEMRLGNYPEREFVVQYDESDLTFLSRLAEHLGICFFFEHGEEESRLVFSDEPFRSSANSWRWKCGVSPSWRWPSCVSCGARADVDSQHVRVP